MKLWRSAMVVLGLVALVCVAIAVFTTFDAVSFRGASCGSPVGRAVRGTPGCERELARARATRNAALAWGLVALTGAWACDAARRRAPKPAGQPTPF